MPMRILVAEADAAAADALVRQLRTAGFETAIAPDGAAALTLLRRRRPDLIVAAHEPPSLAGLDLCRQLRHQPDTHDIGLIILSTHGDIVDRIVGLELGADDYLVKPADPREVVARIHAVLRRLRPAPPAADRAGGVEVDRGTHTAAVDGRPIDLTAREFALLSLLVSAHGRVVRRSTLLKEAWGLEHGDEIATRTIDSHITRLRHKLGAQAHRLITVKGVGYRFDASDAPARPRLYAASR